MPDGAKGWTGEESGNPSAKAPGTRPGLPTPTTESAWTALEDHLAAARRSILEEIRNYPRPIAGCDQQFNYLLEQRELISDELRRLTSLRREETTRLGALHDFIGRSACIDEALKTRLAAELAREPGEAS